MRELLMCGGALPCGSYSLVGEHLLLLTEALHGASSNVGWPCQVLCGFAWSQFFNFDFRTPGGPRYKT